MNLKHDDQPTVSLQGPSADGAPLPADLLAVFAAMPGVSLLLAADAPRFTMLAVSDERLAATMTTREATIGRPLFEVFPDANPRNPDASGVGNLRSSLETVLRTRAQHRMPVQRYVLQRSDGSWEERYWSPLNVPVPGPDGEVRFLLHQVQDVTDEVLGQEALVHAEQGAVRLLNRMSDAHFVLDREFHFVTLNPAAERMTGRPREELLGRTHWEVFPASVHMEIGDAYRRVVAEGVEQHFQQHYVGDGIDRYLEIDAYPTDEGGVAIFSRDISEWVRGVEARRKNEEQRFLAQLGDALRSLGDVGAIQAEAARLLAEQLGASRVLYVETEGDTDETCVILCDHRREALPPLAGRQRFDDYGAYVAETLREKRMLITADLREMPQHQGRTSGNCEAAAIRACVVAPIVKEGRIAACLAVTQSVPRRWTADEVALVKETTERTWAAVERARAEAALRDADRRKDEFLATLAHELRNPLAPVRNGLQILRLSLPDTPASTKTLGMMERQLSHMVRLIDDLLDVSRISRGKVELKRERLTLRSVLDSAVEASRPFIEAGHHELTLHLPYEPLHLDADATRLAQVIGNLLNNAAKYTPDEGRIDVFAEREGEEVVLRVKDNGVGIAPEMLSHVFDLFAQASGSSLERAQGGLGIGLSISRQLAQMHGGSIHAESPGPGQGATFTLRLPLAQDRPKEGEGTKPSAGAANHLAQRVLVVDDNTDAADSFAMMLGLFGHTTRTAYSGPEALATAREFQPSIVFCDIGMPGMNGYAVAEQFRKDPALAQVRLIALTGWGSEDDRRRALEAGFDFHLAKPVEAAAVQELLTRLVEHGRQGARN